MLSGFELYPRWVPLERSLSRAVLKKLEKLDSIESRSSQMHTTLASIEENVSRLDSEVEDLNTKSNQLVQQSVN